ncbi:glycosyltransferase family 2 protein [Candidatus Nomurabacteria bacterium]|uniref:Glycosyltransferase family 2 protein n=1 Tax=candidate division WWE3 bacterium TaxID=2053526 RepID=A0A955IWV4_UNCKA|nr:glycosyltransferase family 2 protein [candidate division WWE3 bacterium]MCB9824140.1 glycosyltransferase family 2 protein [Candidatus Nomurabacteria bacterium]MCB9826889.1 glycosyltransferase family 2 protein [Candidatus Nomurabacteria bacterium]MCB9828081.1 glycosyltransferase family 2 protein [Candidatus Nomurabacteria bacterium]
MGKTLLSKKQKLSKARISVVMPVYNSVKYVDKAVKSILSQSFEDFEFIIIDDCCTDGTSKLLQDFAKADGRIIYERNSKNMKIAYSRNRGIELSTSAYIATMDADDIALPHRLGQQYEFLQNNPDVGVCMGNLNVIDENGAFKYTREYPVSDKDIRKAFFLFNPIPNPTVMCRKEIYETVDGYDEAFHPIDDLDFWIRVGVEYKFGNVGVAVIDYRVHHEGSSHAFPRDVERLTFKLRFKALKLGYRPSAKATILNIVQLGLLYIMPEKFKIPLFNMLRRKGLL